jgi:PAT family beta-lactamase induction signal transducer AmpG
MLKDTPGPAEAPHKHAHPSVFLFLFLPFGIMSGYVTVTFAYLFSKAGVSLEQVAALIAASLLPSVLKFLWVPIVDSSLTLKKWYVIGTIITAVGILATGLLPIKESSLPLLTIIVVAANVAVTFSGMATNGLMAHDTPDELRGIAGGYLQAGNLGGAGIGGGAGLWLAQHISYAWVSPAALAVACLLCCFGLLFIREVDSGVKAESPITTISNLSKDIWLTLKTRLGVLAMILCFLPLGTGAASNLWAAVAGDWHATADTVAIVTGVLGGIVTSVGCLAGGWLCDRMDRQVAYLAFGLMQAVAAVAMAFAPHTEAMYIIWTLMYAFTNGFAYAAFTAFVLDAIGKGAAATKYTVYASLSNIPIYYMTLVDGWAHTHYGPGGMLNVEAACAVVGALLFMALLLYNNRKTVAVAA